MLFQKYKIHLYPYSAVLVQEKNAYKAKGSKVCQGRCFFELER